MIKVLFVIHDLSVGGAEKVLINLVNGMDKTKFDITVFSLFDVGVNKQFLCKSVHYKSYFKYMFRGNSFFLKLFSPQQLFKKFIKDDYDIIISYLEGVSARIVSGCTDKKRKLVSWIHVEQHTKQNACRAFRNYNEAVSCYRRFNQTICVSEAVKTDFCSLFDIHNPVSVLFNTNDTDNIIELSKKPVDPAVFSPDEFKICVVGKISKRKGCDRIVRIQKKLRQEGFNTHIYFLGVGSDETYVRSFMHENDLEDSITLLGYQTNPYKYMKACDLFLCASLAEGFSTATVEALIVGIPVVTVDVSGMKEILGENQYGIITQNNEDALYNGIKDMISLPHKLHYYVDKAKERGKFFCKNETVGKVENMLENILNV